MEQQEYQFRPRGRHGFDRDDVIDYITQAKQRCNEHLARMEELDAAKNAWYTQAKTLEREKAALAARCRELEEQLERGGAAAPAGDQWFAPLPGAESQELTDLRARCRELEQSLEEQQKQAAGLVIALEAMTAKPKEELPSVHTGDTEPPAQEDGFVISRDESELISERNALKASLESQLAEKQILAEKLSALEQEKADLEAKLAALAAYEESVPALQAQLARLEASSTQLAALEKQLEEAQDRLEAGAQDAEAQAGVIAALQAERTALVDEIAGLRAQIAELESVSSEHNQEAIRSMVLSSFNYSNLYVDNNLKTAQFISEATSRNIGRVSDAASSLLEQVDAIGRYFDEASDTMRRDLAAFQRELNGIQTGMNRRLSKDRFKALLEENERLRNQLETELLAELSSEEEMQTLPPMQEPAAMPRGPLPFAEDLTAADYQAFLAE